MEIFVMLFTCLLIPGTILPASCQYAEVNINCSKDHHSSQCGKDPQVANGFNETTMTFQVNERCGQCTLRGNLLAKDYMMILSLKATSTWGSHDYFYINQTDGFLAFTGQDDTCRLNIYQNNLNAQFFLNGEIYIQFFPQSSDTCQTADCVFSDNCTNLHKVQEIFMIEYKEVPPDEIFLADFVQVSYIREHITREAKGQYPECIPGCICTMEISRHVAHCENGMNQETLLIQQETDFTEDVYISLNVENRGITAITKGAFQGFQHINILYLSDNPLTQVRPDIFEGLGSVSLGAIELRNCSISKVPSRTFAAFPLLMYVDLSENFISSFHPGTFLYQPFLLALVMGQNLLSTLPTDLFKRTNKLLLLDLRHNRLRELNPDLLEPVPDLRILQLDHNELHTLQPGNFRALTELDRLLLADNKLTEILPEEFEGLQDVDQLDLSGNNISSLVPGQFDKLIRIFEIKLSRNTLKKISFGAFGKNELLRNLEIDNNELETLDMHVFSNLTKLSVLQLSNNKLKSLTFNKNQSASEPQKDSKQWPILRLFLLENNYIDYIDDDVFKEIPNLQLVNIQNNSLKLAQKKTFRTLSNQTRVFVTEAATCCFTGNAVCSSEKPQAPYLTCQRLLPKISLQVFMWVIGLFAVIGNLFVLIWRCINHGHENDVQLLLILNLAASDLLMGVYMLIIAGADNFYGEFFPSHADSWRNGSLCKVAGILSILSSEASVFFVTIISLDRFLVIRSNFGTWRISKKTMINILTSLWIFALVLSIVPTVFSGVDSDFYDVSEVCIGLPFVRSREFVNTTTFMYEYDFSEISLDVSSDKELVYNEVDHIFADSQSPGLFYSIVLFLGLNLVCFIIIAFCYCGIFIIFKHSQKQIRSTNLNQQLNLAIRMGLIVVTDFLCWMPIVVIGILVQSSTLTISPVVYVYIVVFVLPINSAANPFLYSVPTIVSNYKKKKQNQAKSTSNKQMQNLGKATKTVATSLGRV